MTNKLISTRQVIARSLNFVKGDTVDLGAGTAKYRHLIKSRAKSYLTFDMSPGQNIDVVGDILNLPFANENFDTVIATQVLEHVKKPWVMIAEMARVLRPDGVCIISAPFLVPYHADPDDYFRYTTSGLRALAEEAGLATLECSSYGGLAGIFSELVHFSFFNPYKGPLPMWRQRVFRYWERCALFFDRWLVSKIAYPNVYIIAQKK